MGKHVRARQDIWVRKGYAHREWRAFNWLTYKASYRSNPRLVAWSAIQILAVYAYFRRKN